jgi:anaerobic magnesium-protoporphyrin IX monomethyl ester cyclase
LKVLFIYPVPQARFQILRYQQGLGSISAVLKQAGHDARLLTLDRLDTEALDAAVRDFQPQLVGLSLTSGFFALGQAITGWVAARHKLPVVLGGVHPTLCPEESIAIEGAFAICRGEGEYPMRELCAALESGGDPTRIANLWVRANGQVHQNELRPLIADLDALPPPDRALFPMDHMVDQFAEIEFMGSRGCPFQCAYCVNHALQELYRGKGPFVRFRTVDNFLNEIDTVMRSYPRAGIVGLHDDTFTLNRNWFREFTDKYPARFKHPFWCNATADSINEETVRRLKQAGCYEVRIGVESGNDHLRQEILCKKVSREAIVRAFRLLQAAGIHTYAFNMVGLPYETVATIHDTINLNRILQPDETFCSVFCPFPGTHAYDVCRANGWLRGQAAGSYFENSYVLDQPSIRRADVLFYHDIFADLVRWPRAHGLIKGMARIRVTRTKSLWNVWRRVRAKCKEAKTYVQRAWQLGEFSPRRQPNRSMNE